jgi:hypothetical protein
MAQWLSRLNIGRPWMFELHQCFFSNYPGGSIPIVNFTHTKAVYISVCARMESEASKALQCNKPHQHMANHTSQTRAPHRRDSNPKPTSATAKLEHQTNTSRTLYGGDDHLTTDLTHSPTIIQSLTQGTLCVGWTVVVGA